MAFRVRKLFGTFEKRASVVDLKYLGFSSSARPIICVDGYRGKSSFRGFFDRLNNMHCLSLRFHGNSVIQPGHNLYVEL